MQQNAQRHHGQHQVDALRGQGGKQPMIEGIEQVVEAADTSDAKPPLKPALPDI